MLKRKVNGVMMGSSPSPSPSSSYLVDGEARTRSKFLSLMQEYSELQKETEKKRNRVQLAKRRRRVLLAEVRFLRQRYEELMEYQSQEQARAQFTQAHRDVVRVDKSRRDTKVAVPNPAPVLDLNQVANDDEEETRQMDYEPKKIEKNRMKFSVSRGGKPPLPPKQQKDLKLTVCRDIQKGSNRAVAKRKISLHDAVPLSV